MKLSSVIARHEDLIFGHRRLIIALFLLVTAFMAWSATQLRIDAGFSKLLPMQHEYMRTFADHQQEFGGANRVLIAVMAREGDMFTPEFFRALKEVTDEVFFIPGIDRTQVRSIFTPNVRFTEVVEDGIAGGNVVPDDFDYAPEDFEEVRSNILKAGILGRLVASDFSGAIVSAELMEVDPTTGERLDYIGVSRLLEERIRERFEGPRIDIHMVGFAKVVGAIADGAMRIVGFFLIAFIITALLVFYYTQSLKLTVIPLICSLVAVVWQLGLLTRLDFGIDPMGILVPFLIFAIGVSHGVQMITANGAEVFAGADAMTAARASFRRLVIPGTIALVSDTIGFITILLIDIQVIQEMAVAASLGVAVIILTNLILLPVLLSFLHYGGRYRARLRRRTHRREKFWRFVARASEPRAAAVILLIGAVLLVVGGWKGSQVRIGDLHRGVPELRPDSRYNRDSELISDRFAIGVDILTVIVETAPEGCVDFQTMETIDRFDWHMSNVEGVQSVVSLPRIAKGIHAAWNEGSPKWRVLPRNQAVLVQSVTYVPTSSGLLNADCSVMPVMVFTEDHKAQTINRIVGAVKNFQREHGSESIRFRLATGNVGVMAASNEEVESAQFPILLYVFGAVLALCWLEFRSLRGVLCILLPLGLVSLLAYALMSVQQIGLKVSTLPVVALGVGIGVDYGIYFFSRLQSVLREGVPLPEAHLRTLRITGSGIVFTGLTLAIGVATWIFSPLQFQADMGILLTFMFLLNMLGAIILLPALAGFLLRPGR